MFYAFFRPGPRRISLTLLLVSMLTLIGSGQARAAPETGPAVLEELVVSAARTVQPASAIPGSVTILPTAVVEAQAAISDDLASVLSATVPGFAPSSQKLAGRAETLRGRNPLYLIDGVPQHNALRDGQRDGHSIDLAFIERIEVINGSNAIQGVGATGGVVNLVTRGARSEDRWTGQVDARLSTANDLESDALGYKLSGTAGRRFGKLDVLVGAAWNRRGLFLDSDGDPVGLYPTQGDIMDSESLALFGKLDWQLTDASSLALMFNDFDLERNGDFSPVPGDRSAGIPSGTRSGGSEALVGNPARNEASTYTLTYRHEALLGGTVEAQLYRQEFTALFEGGTFGNFFRLTPAGDPFLDQSAIESEKTGLRSTYNRRFEGPRLNLTAGFDAFRDESAQVLARSGREWVPESRFESLAPFLQLGWDLSESITLGVGLRQESATLDVASFTTIAAANSTFVSGGSPDFSETLINLSAIWQVTDAWRLYASRSEGFTMPDVGRVLRGISTPGLDVDSLLDVEPIVTDNLEAGVEWDNGRFRSRLSVFESSADNGARLRSNAAGIFEVERQRTEIQGLEFTLDAQLSDALRLGGNIALTRGEFDSDGQGGVDSDLDGLNIGPDRLNLYLDGQPRDDLRWRLQLSYLRDRSFSGPGAPVDRDFAGYALANGFIAWRSRIGELSLAVENLTNEDYFTYFAQTEPAARSDTFFRGNGRTLAFGWRLDFE